MKIKSNSNIFIEEYPFAKELKDELGPVLEEYQDEHEQKTNVKATMTEWKWDPKSDRVKRLKNIITERACYNFSWGPVNGQDYRFYLRDFWGNVYRKGEYTKSHHHKPASYSFVYFLKAKLYDSPLVFTDYGQKVRPKEGTYVIFPSYLLHHVPKHKSDETRMTLSGNLFLQAKCEEDATYLNFQPQVTVNK